MRKTFFMTLITASISLGSVQAQSVTNYQPVSVHYVNLADDVSITGQPIQTEKLLITPSVKSESAIVVKLDEVIHPNLSGIGGAFNEQGGEAFMSLTKKGQKELAKNLFNPQKGMGFSMCRTAVGSSDFGLSAYSYSEIAEDYEMKHFSIDRDMLSVIPFINAGEAQNPDLRIFASPWSPPGWMKETGVMDDGAIREAQGPKNKMMWVNNGKNYLRDEVRVYESYALYFAKYIQAYAEQGITIERLAIQNETDMNTIYPSCDMSPEQMSKLAFDYIQPTFDKMGIGTELWAGTFRGKRDDAEKFITLDGSDKIDGIAMQYAGGHQVKSARELGFSVMHTEGKCYNSKNTMAQARSRFGEVCMWLNAGSENYCYWNMVLNEESKSGWGWKQNSMIKIDRQTQTITYNADYAPMALLSTFIRPGDQSLHTSRPDKVDALVVRNANRVVVFLQNTSAIVESQNIEIASQNYTVELPAHSLCAFVFEN